MSDYNGDLAASRKLSEEEASELRELLISQLSYSKDEQEDVNDLLDYTFAMTSNGKSLSYMVEELVSMEMSVCQEPQAHLIAKQIATFLEERVNQVQSEEPEEEEEQKQSHVVSLKVCMFRFLPRLLACRIRLAYTLSHPLYHYKSLLELVML